MVKLSDRKYRIAFLGGADIKPSEQVYKDAYRLATKLVQANFEITNGGGPGIMRAATEGAKAAGGRVLGITYHPSYAHKNYEGVDPQNKFDEEIVTMDYFDRTKVMLQNSDLHVVFNGGTGTFSELGMTWASSRIHEGHNKPIVLFGAFWTELLNFIKATMRLRPGELELLTVCASIEEAMDFINTYFAHPNTTTSIY